MRRARLGRGLVFLSFPGAGSWSPLGGSFSLLCTSLCSALRTAGGLWHSPRERLRAPKSSQRARKRGRSSTLRELRARQRERERERESGGTPFPRRVRKRKRAQARERYSCVFFFQSSTFATVQCYVGDKLSLRAEVQLDFRTPSAPAK